MLRRIHVGAIVLMAIGSLLGYAAASGKLNLATWGSIAQASPNYGYAGNAGSRNTSGLPQPSEPS